MIKTAQRLLHAGHAPVRLGAGTMGSTGRRTEAGSGVRGREAVEWAERAIALAPGDRGLGLLVAPSLALGTSYGGDRPGAHAALVTTASSTGYEQAVDYLRAGGTLVTMGGATAWAVRGDVNLSSARPVGPDSTSNAAAAPAADTAATGAGDVLAVTSPGAEADAPAPVPGAMFDATLDRTHWLTTGVDQARVTALVEGDTFLRLSRNGTNVAVFPRTGAFYRAGFTWPGNTERLLRNTALVVEEALGRGHVVLFQNEPTFRGWVRSMDRLVLNALVLGPSF